MSSRFPALEEIDDDLLGSDNAADFTSGNDDFLSREKAALGADASEFQTSDDIAVATQGDEVDDFNEAFPALEKKQVSSSMLIFQNIAHANLVLC